MSNVLKVGIIGTGMIADQLHVPDYNASPHAEVVAVCDIVPGKADAFAKKHVPDARVYRNHQQMLNDGGLDAVSVCLPNKLHAPVTIDSLKAGCHVLVEKPMATTSAEAQRMINAANAAERILMVNQCQRLAQASRKAKEVLDSGIMGRVLYVNAMFGHEGPIAWSPDGKWFLRKKDAAFGAMADLGIHKADLLRFLTGKEIVEVSAFTETLDTKSCDVEDNFAACIKFDDGAIGTLGASWTARGLGTDHVILHCERGTLRVQLWEGKPCVAHLANPECEINFDLPEPHNHYPDSWGMDAGGKFAKACLGLEEPFCSAEEGKKSLEVILACQKAATTGRRVKIK